MFNVNMYIVFTYLSESYLDKQSQTSYSSKPSQSSIGMLVYCSLSYTNYQLMNFHSVIGN